MEPLISGTTRLLWGVATASYQIEGATSEDGRGTSIWDTFCDEPGRIRHGHTGAVACDSYHRYGEDVALVAGLGADLYRFSVAWPRIQPDGHGPVNVPGLDYYDRLVDGLLERGVEPMPTLYHWDLPQRLEDEGGWLARDTAFRFADYADAVVARLGDRVDRWITLNEPFVHTVYGYALGFHAPGRQLLLDALPAAHHQLLGHALAAAALRTRAVGQILLVNNYSPISPASPSSADITAAAALDTLQNHVFTEPLLRGSYPDLSVFGSPDMNYVYDGDLAAIAGSLDGLGVNYYTPTVVRTGQGPLPFELAAYPDADVATTAFGWPVVPEGLHTMLCQLYERYARTLPPIYVTESGCSLLEQPDERGVIDDAQRIDYLDGHIDAVRRAVADGVDVRGYLVWSLLDNFEWSEGFTQRFGLVYVDFETQRRIPKASYHWYRDLIGASRRDRGRAFDT